MKAAKTVVLSVVFVSTMSYAARGNTVSNWSSLFGNFGAGAVSNGSAPSVQPVFYNASQPVSFTPSLASTPVAPPAAPVYSAPAPVVAAPAASLAIAPPATTADAFLNFGNAPYDEAALLTSGGASSWYNSPSVLQAFGHVPTPQEQQDFTSTVLARVQSTYALSGIPITLTTDPNAHTAHSLSIVSGTSYAGNPDAIGITDIGHSGFSFIDKLSYATNPNDLEWAVAHNVAHELMHAFGGGHHDQTGQYLDAPSSSWNTLLNPNLTFSSASVQELTQDLATGGSTSAGGSGLEVLQQFQGQFDADDTNLPAPVPEPATLALWGLAAVGTMIARRKTRKSA